MHGCTLRQRYAALDLKLCIVRLGLVKQAIKRVWMARWERESVEVVITLLWGRMEPRRHSGRCKQDENLKAEMILTV